MSRWSKLLRTQIWSLQRKGTPEILAAMVTSEDDDAGDDGDVDEETYAKFYCVLINNLTTAPLQIKKSLTFVDFNKSELFLFLFRYEMPPFLLHLFSPCAADCGNRVWPSKESLSSLSCLYLSVDDVMTTESSTHARSKRRQRLIQLELRVSEASVACNRQFSHY